jgi:DNA-binding NarL/FixJ family response regulator
VERHADAGELTMPATSPVPLRRGVDRHGLEVARALPAHTVVLADALPALRHGVRALVEQGGGFTVVAEAGTAPDTVAAVVRHRPDVLVLDPELPGGAAVIEQVARAAPRTGVLVFTALDDDESVSGAVRAGARGYLVKDAGIDQILRGIQVVAAGEMIVGGSVAKRFGTLVRAPGPALYPFPQLTPKERDVLELVAAGRSNLAIARELLLASKTISNRISTIFVKLAVADRAQAIVLARDAGLGRTPV